MQSEKAFPTPAGFWLRLGANLFDAAIVFFVQYLLLLVVGVVDAFSPSGLHFPMVALLLFASVSPIFAWAYLRSNGRMSPGYRVAGLRLETMSGVPVGFGRSLMRLVVTEIVALLVAILALIDWLYMVLNRDRRAVHDLIFRTKVVAVHQAKPLVLWGCVGFYAVLLGLIGTRKLPLPLQAFYVPSGSMKPTLHVNDRLLSNPLAFRFRAPRYGEVTVLKAPHVALLNEHVGAEVDFVKRVVGVPGQVVEMKKGQLFVNGQRKSETYVKWDTGLEYDMKIVDGAVYSREYIEGDMAGPWTQMAIPLDEVRQSRIMAAKPQAVPADEYLVLGDYRSNSNDSHLWGFAPRGAFENSALFIYWPLSRMRFLN